MDSLTNSEREQVEDLLLSHASDVGVLKKADELDAETTLLTKSDDCVTGVLLYSHASSNTALVTHLVVHPEYRQQGLATELFRRLGLETTYSQVRVYSYEENILAAQFYESLGFRLEGSEDGALEWEHDLEALV